MKKVKKRIVILFILICFLLQPVIIYADDINIESESNIVNVDNQQSTKVEYRIDEQIKLDNEPEIGCKAAYIAEPSTGKVIYEKNAHEKLYPASTTKILTALVVMENCEMNESAVVSKRALALVPAGYSNAKLQAGEEHTIETLLYALLLPSANEAANVLAEQVSGSVEEFVDLCNKRAKELGCENLHFTNTNGMHDEEHYCSAYDLYLIAKECRKYDIFNEIVKTKSFTVPATNIYPRNDRTFKNTNELLQDGTYYYSYCTGIKTGHTTPAGECLVASSTYNNIDLISVVLGGKSQNSLGLNERFYDTKQLFEFTYDNYAIKEISNLGDVVAKIKVGKATKNTSELDAIVDTDFSTIIPNSLSKENIQTTVIIDDDITAPILENQVIGKITYHADGINYTTNVVASHLVEKLPYEKYNVIVVIVGAATMVMLIVFLLVCKNHRIIVCIIGVIVIIIEVIGVFFVLKKGAEDSITEINVLDSNQSAIEIQNSNN